MIFWIRNGVLAILLLGLAWFFLANQDYLLSLNDSSPEQHQGTPTKATTAKIKPSYQQNLKSKNAAAEGLSSFYEKIYGDDMSKNSPTIRNNIIFLPKPQGNLIEMLQAREMTVNPYQKNWRGTVASRPFRKKQTLYQKLAEYAEEEGLEVIWWLNKDFIVKDPFRIEKNILQTAYQIGEAVSGHFPEGIVSYFCYRQRTLVFINEAPAYLENECINLKPKGAF